MSAVKRGLGKGLDVMIPLRISEKETEGEENVSRETLVPINEIEPNKSQPRKKFDQEALQELADSIRQFGVIQPLIVQKRDKYYEIIAGERRWRAARLAGLKEVPVIIKDYSPQEIVEIALIENIQREDLNPIEEAQAYQRLITEFNLKHEELAERVSKSRAAITNSLRLLKLDSRIQQMLINEQITGGHARALLSLEDSDLQYETARKIIDENLSVRDTEKLVKKLISKKAEKEIAVAEDANLVYQALEEKLKNILGTKVLIKRKKKNAGKIEIEYYSDEELERILEMFDSLNYIN
ncbi:ParB family chromosome partitioning protein [Herbinix hemicellulosilytica]|uniref:Putative chromosome-partitioning protein ParB n=1 Tax=Herbinix hemicellulosilytica TaxID=1564487 RepID=A0A0H5SKQ0_HERHM|nr:ParB/RepB/Spo0J family partition protein [Herbinix hemicellulosilytica]RBP57349.1 ParB family chromosome partitioning protein [Herbinix hemicellulosilytica]CRZ35690.1 putative chromosome-partitioning protein ParB [Herbinix hemicellulosilytica]